ncbi:MULTISPECIES: fimbrial biogenesis chaperone [Lelliottia]|uniref:Molecular chaperone n=1 Tax=Lelliottia aquatilis TaxID=2080838 RepID=A0ABX4ZX58_9ENTR|nr:MULTISPECIES: molecular chaperone [Lelliottia]POZ13796.1 molecular chaperone [Lelliottia aquatilis]POZ15204.1 molecular chaperone [Lelliottia sp. 7254-16]POZ18943.1 molecular chaperone [Lelliottia aquatilis]POZ20511.1 molecular chaperone [Lelliottia aquatilis]POZ30564.1 molecular chaperone [Lelliottia aquatilis]
MNKKQGRPQHPVGEERDVRYVCLLLFTLIVFFGWGGPERVFSAPVGNISQGDLTIQNAHEANSSGNEDKSINEKLTPPVNNTLAREGSGGINKDSQGVSKSGLTFYPMLMSYSQKDSKGGVVVNVVNPSASSYLLQGNINAFDPATGRASTASGAGNIPPFVVLPPLSRLEASGRTALRVRQVGSGLPSDRESAAVVSVLAVPPQNAADEGEKSEQAGKKGGGSRIQLALRMNMLLFWRPETVPEPVPGQVAKALTFRARGNNLEVNNPTPYFVHFAALSVGGERIPESARAAWVSPLSSHTFSLTRTVSGPLVWTLTGEKDEHQTGL